MREQLSINSADEMRDLGARLAGQLRIGDVVLLYGKLGAGKTTLVRGFIDALGYEGPVRSPTFNLIQFFKTQPPVMHVDLYRVASHVGLGIEDELPTHVSFIEWAEKASGLISVEEAWRIHINFAAQSRDVVIEGPLQG